MKKTIIYLIGCILLLAVVGPMLFFCLVNVFGHHMSITDAMNSSVFVMVIYYLAMLLVTVEQFNSLNKQMT